MVDKENEAQEPKPWYLRPRKPLFNSKPSPLRAPLVQRQTFIPSRPLRISRFAEPQDTTQKEDAKGEKAKEQDAKQLEPPIEIFNPDIDYPRKKGNITIVNGDVKPNTVQELTRSQYMLKEHREHPRPKTQGENQRFRFSINQENYIHEQSKKLGLSFPNIVRLLVTRAMAKGDIEP